MLTLTEETPVRWRIERQGAMRVPGIVFALSLIHISEPTRLDARSRMPSSA